MGCIDLHVHSKYSEHPSEWFLQRIGTRESYTEIESLYRMAKKQGMQCVTITDHNTIQGALELTKMYPHDTFVSTEVTAYFPENECKIHILLYGITEKQFAMANEIRTNIYTLRNYLNQEGIVHSVAHATYSVNGKLTADLVEKLILMFDVFEGINGARNPYYNTLWRAVLNSLTPEAIERLYKKHGIAPLSKDPWIKGFTGGSDDHAGLFVGQTYTMTSADSPLGMLEAIRNKTTYSQGRSNDYKGLAFTIYKIAYEFSKDRMGSKSSGMWAVLNEILFEKKELGIKQWFVMQKMKRSKKHNDQILTRFIDDVVSTGSQSDTLSTDEKINRVYDHIATLADNFFTMVISSCQKDFTKGDTGKMLKNILSALPTIFLSVPFLSALKHLHSDRGLVTRLRNEFVGEPDPREKKILWFSDTIEDLNGVSVTLQKLMSLAAEKQYAVTIAGCYQNDAVEAIKANRLDLPFIYEYKPEFYHAYTLRIPSVLKSMELIYEYHPDEIIVSTPGPVGMVGVLAARLLGVKCTGVYHTDFTKQMELMLQDTTMAELFERYTKWFYSLMDEIRVPTQTYIGMLEARGYERMKMKLFKRGIDTVHYRYDAVQRERIRAQYHVENRFVMMWAGRVSKDKNIPFVLDMVTRLEEKGYPVSLFIVGDGPDYKEIQKRIKKNPNIHCIGSVSQEDMPALYSAADVFVFPSVMDTFGMVVLEAQACGLPSLVTTVGGPQEIVEHEKTGFVLDPHDAGQWVQIVERLYAVSKDHPETCAKLREVTMHSIRQRFSWDKALRDIISLPCDESADLPIVHISSKKENACAM